MRYPLMTIHGANDIEITATKELNEKEFLSGEVVNGVVIYCEQWKPEYDDFAGVSFLLKDGVLTVLKNHLFTYLETDDLMNIIGKDKEVIKDIVGN